MQKAIEITTVINIYAVWVAFTPKSFVLFKEFTAILVFMSIDQ